MSTRLPPAPSLPGPVRRVALFLLSIVAIVAAGPLAAATEPRLALVIGNGAYTQVPPLRNPPNDARLIAATLEELDFAVTLELDVGQKDLKRAIQDFGRQIRSAGRDAVALVYYAGHSVQVGGSNFLIPVSAAIETEGDVDIEAIDVGALLSTIDYAGARMAIVILDACRDNPYASGFRSATRGLARVDAPAGALVAYATAPGQVALDGDGEHSPYSQALARAMRTPGLTVEKMFRRVRNDVLAATNDRQVPWESSSLTGADFHFRPADPEPPAEPAATAAPPPAPPADAAVTVTQVELAFWRSIEASTDPADFSAYLQRFPDGVFAPLARNRLAAAEARTASMPPPRTVAPSPTPSPSPSAAVPPLAASVPPPAAPAPTPTAPSEPEPAVPPAAAMVIDPVELVLFTQRTANVRSAPATGAARLATLAAGTRVRVTGAVRGQAWSRVALAAGGDGFISSPLLGPEQPRTETLPPREAPAAPPRSAPPAAANRPPPTTVPPEARAAPPATVEPAPPAGNRRFDGGWTVILDIEPGACPQGNLARSTFVIVVSGGEITGSWAFGGRPYKVTGSISEAGALTMSTAETYASFSAKAGERGGKGRWRNNQGCFGEVTLLR